MKSTFYLVCIIYIVCKILCILCNPPIMGVYLLLGQFWLESSNYQEPCACCTIAESGAINEKSAQSAQKTAKKYGHSAQMIGYVFVHVAQGLFKFLWVCLNNFLIPHLTPSNCKHYSFKPQHTVSYIQEISIYCIFSCEARSDPKIYFENFAVLHSPEKRIFTIQLCRTTTLQLSDSTEVQISQ